MSGPPYSAVQDDGESQSAPHVLRTIGCLHRILRHAIERVIATYGAETAGDPFRGLYISQHDAMQLLEGGPVATFGDDGRGEPPLLDDVDQDSALAELTRAYGLTNFDLGVILIALAPEVDLRYERIYAFLQDDVSRRSPSVDLALNLLSPTPAQKLVHRSRFGADAPLVRHELVELVGDPDNRSVPLLARSIKLGDAVVRRLLAEEGLDPVLRKFGAFLPPGGALDDLPLPPQRRHALAAFLYEAQATRTPLRLYFSGPQGDRTKRRTAQALAGMADLPLLAVDLGGALGEGVEFNRAVRAAVREARLRQAILYVEPLDVLLTPDRSVEHQQLLRALAGHTGGVILAGAEPNAPRGSDMRALVEVPFPIPSHDLGAECWRAALEAADVAVADQALEQLAGRFRLTPDEIAGAVDLARGNARWRAATAWSGTPDVRGAKPTVADLFDAARRQSNPAMAGLASKVDAVHGWDDVVLPDDTVAQLREMCQQVVQRHRVLDEWGFGRRLSVGNGVTALFAGPSGTGKTMAASIIALELGLDLYKIDLSGVVSKYIGETEKNLERIFTAAENANAILLFDEADALFGKRSEVRDSHDRYANIEVAYLLQRMDQYEGVAILATNLRKNMDDAFVRRLGFAVEFPFPDEEQRARIWRLLFPPQAHRASDIDFRALGAQLRITGGSIKNIVLSAAFLAAGANEPITTDHLLHAARREYAKLGKVLLVDLHPAGANPTALIGEGT